jgi:high-affinity Fe2+/Pb2+ permease
MDPQIAKRGSKIWPLLLLGVLVLVVLVLLFGKQKSAPNTISEDKENKILEILRSKSNSVNISSEQQAEVVKRLQTKPSKPKLTESQENEIINRLSR